MPTKKFAFLSVGCASGSGGERNIFGNKYGQYLAAIQVAREDRLAARTARLEREAEDEEDDGETESDDGANEDDDNSVVGAADGSSGKKSQSIWASDVAEEEHVELDESMMGRADAEAEREGRAAARNVGAKDSNDRELEKPNAKRSKQH
jgi:hypothetical protein